MTQGSFSFGSRHAMQIAGQGNQNLSGTPLVLLSLLSLSLVRVDAAAAASSFLAGPGWEKGVSAAADMVGVQKGAASAAKEEEEGRVVPERVEMALSINDYPSSGANSRHISHP
ncbi:uncharacterized protein LOC133931102 [Phragmites australis]|uniref:uncharacterized protein LOC133931102 n=1 Tax=Phragmites australis TaxID=29695 RepID=UPI002D778A32|nr:uncharacterized protein LOC133931102 [Phragmites australis]